MTDRQKKEIVNLKNHKSSHHKTNFLVELYKKNTCSKRLLVNSGDSLNALRVALCRVKRLYPTESITRARVAGVYPASVKRIEKRIG